jgi:hypothetical protein
MTKPKAQYFILITVSVLGLLLPHSDRFIIIFAFLFIPIALTLLALLIYFFAITLGYRKSNRKKFVNGRTGLLAILLLVVMPFVSVFILDTYSKYISNQLIYELEAYKKQKGEYPTDIQQLGIADTFGRVKYIYYPHNRNYALSYKSRGTVTTKYENHDKHWRHYGWND